MKIAAALVKTAKYAVSQGGDSAEVVERPLGGISALVVDGQGSGRGAKALSIALAGRVVTLINDGARDGAVVRTVHDWLFAQKQGKVSATIGLLSVATDTNTLVATRSGHCPIFVCTPDKSYCFDAPSQPLGFYRFTRPQVEQLPLVPNLMAVAFSDGVLSAGRRQQLNLSNAGWLEKIEAWYQLDSDPGIVAEKTLAYALELDSGRPGDDMTVAVVTLLPAVGDGLRRLRVEYPLE